MSWYGVGTYGSGRYGEALTVTTLTQDTWPPRVAVTVTGTGTGETVDLYRSVAGVRTLIRGGSEDYTENVADVYLDAELPYGVAVTYIAVVDGQDVESDPVTVELTGGKVALSDAISGDAAEVVVLAWPEKGKQRRSTVYPVGGRNVVVAGQRSGFTSAIDFYTETETSRLAVDALLESATSGVVQLRQSGGYYGVDGYLAVLSDTEKRWSQDGSDERRIWTLEVVEVEGWADELAAAGFTYEDLADAFDTYQDIADEFDSLLEIAQADLS